METKPFRIAFVSQVLALATQLYLTVSHYKLKFGLAEGKSLCNISSSFNCDAVSVSQYAVFLGAPVALWGLLTNGVLFFGLISLLWNKDDSSLKARNHFFASLILLASVVMGLISATMLNTFCLFCIFAYVLSAITFWTVGRLNGNYSPFSALPVKKLSVPLIFVPVMTLALNHVIATNMGAGLERYVQESLQTWKTNPNVDLGEIKGLHMGKPINEAKMLMVEFADFQCIHCKMAGPTLKNFTASRNDVALVFMPFPLDGKCNKNVPQAGDGLRCELAKAVHCASLQNRGWEAHDWVFDHFQGPSLADLSTYLEKLGIDIAAFRSCREGAEAESAIAQFVEMGTRAGVQGTPTILVNGRILPRAVFLMTLEAAHKELNGL